MALNEGIEIKATGSVQLPHCHSFAKVASIGETIDGLMEGVSPLTGYSSSITERDSSCGRALADTFNGFGQIAESASESEHRRAEKRILRPRPAGRPQARRSGAMRSVPIETRMARLI